MNRFFTLLLAASCLTAVGQVPDYVPTDGLVAWYPLDGDGQDAGGNGLHGQVMGATAALDRFQSLNGALFFDGQNDFVSVQDNALFEDMTTSFTVSIWIKNVTWLEANWLYYLSKADWYGQPPFSGSFVLRAGADGGGGFGYNATIETTGGDAGVGAPEPLYEGWEHVVYRFDGDNIQIFRNGVLAGSNSTSGGVMLSNDADLTIGSANNGQTHHALATLDDIGIWSRSLTEEEILNLYTTTPPPLLGCTDASACNFEEDASEDDGSCVYAPTIDLGEDIVSCEEWVVLEAQDGQFFHWSTGESDSIIEVSQTGFYAVEASSQIGEPNVISGHTFIGRLGQSDYYISEASISWEDARMQSESLGGHLAVITSPEENELVWQGVFGNGLNPGGTNNYQAWIGLYQDFESPDYAEPNGGWRWVTDEAVSYLNWAANRPGNLDQGYFVHMTDANGNCPEGDIVCGTWDDSGISANLQSAFYVLEVESPYGPCTSSDSIFVEFNHGSCFCGPGTIWEAEMQMCIGDGSGDINLDGCVQLNDLLDLLSAYGDCGAEESAWQCGDPLEYQGYDYETVQIGEQCWFAENCRYLPSVSPPEIGLEDDGQPHYYVLGYEGSDPLEAAQTSEYLTFGVLYNSESILNGGVCPSGWNVPSDSDWMHLESFIGLSDDSLEYYGYRGNLLGTELKSSQGWNGTNAYGMNILPGGCRNANGIFCQSDVTSFWTISEGLNSGFLWRRYLSTSSAQIGRGYSVKRAGFSVRCIKDAE